MTREKYKLKTDRKKFFYPKDFQKILDIANVRQYYNLISLINTGARINEIRHVDPQDLDKQRYNMLLRVTKVRAKLKEKRPSPRIIAVSTKFFKYFKKNIQHYKIYSTNNYGKMLRILSKKANIPGYEDYSSHNMRKTFGCWMLALGVDGFKLAQHMGQSPDMLRTSYASPDIFNSEDKDRMREILNDLPSRLRN
ncbi:hypothetical protein CL617_00635 [archaeon]|nr:hypothetical protein [archaeon]|tara:strand:- start:5048 stop:5632 length:585 start_codon:yes stop_codon:yes gene_type:complete